VLKYGKVVDGNWNVLWVSNNNEDERVHFEEGDYSHMMCCGITELSFESLFEDEDLNSLSQGAFEEVIALHINARAQAKDHRMLIASGIVGCLAYDRLKEVLSKFGFRQVHRRAYTNKNSGNRIWVMVGQL